MEPLPAAAVLQDSGFNPAFAPEELFTMLTGGANAGRFRALYADGDLTDVSTGGTFTINEAKNEKTSNNHTLIQNPARLLNYAVNRHKIIKAFPTEFITNGIWPCTSYDAVKDEWFAFRYIIPWLIKINFLLVPCHF